MHIKFLPSVDFRYLPQVFRRLASTNVDTETFCIVLLTSQVVMVQSLQPKGLEFESTCVIFYGDLVGYNLDIMRQSACLVLNPITVYSCGFLFNCTMVGQASDSMTALT